MLALLLKKLMKEPALKAAVLSLFVSRSGRWSHPDGTFDSAGRFYPADTEKVLDSFDGIRRPTRSWPYSYMLRARTRDHCKRLVLASLVAKGSDSLPKDVVAEVGELPFRAIMIGRMLLPKAYAADAEGIALAASALADFVAGNSEPLRWGVLADWLADRGFEKVANEYREAAGLALTVA